MTSSAERQVLREATPVPGESLRGLVADTCAKNRIANTWSVLRYFGMLHRNRVDLSESGHLDTAGLATALRVDEQEILIRRYPLHSGSNRLFNGIQVPVSRIENATRRFSPAAIADGELHHPGTHELRDLPFSTVGWDLLQDRCPCEVKPVIQRWTRTNSTHRCDSCGARLDRVPRLAIAKGVCDALGLIAGLVDGDPEMHEEARAYLPIELRGCDRSLLYGTIINITRCIEPGRREGGTSPMARTEAMARACEMLSEWPNGFDRIDRSDDCPTYVWEAARRSYAVLDVIDTGPDGRGALTAQTGCEALADVTNVTPRARFTARGSHVEVRTELLSAMATARLCCVDEAALKQAWDEGRLTQHSWVQGGRPIRVFDPAEALALAPRLRVANARAHIARMLGMPVYGIEQLLGIRLITPADPDAETYQAKLYRDAADVFVARLMASEAELIDEPLLLIEAVRHVSGRPKPWAAVFDALVRRVIPFRSVPGADGKQLVRRLHVPAQAVAAIVDMKVDEASLETIEIADRWTQFDSLECLNGYKNTLGPLAEIDARGVGSKMYLAADVRDRCAHGVTTSDLARRWGTDTKSLFKTLERNGVGQIAPSLWDRTAAEGVLNHAKTMGPNPQRDSGSYLKAFLNPDPLMLKMVNSAMNA